MSKHILILCLVLFTFFPHQDARSIGLPKTSLWPKPTTYVPGASVFRVDPHSLQITSNSQNDALKLAISRTKDHILATGPQAEIIYPSPPAIPDAVATVTSLRVTVENDKVPLSFGVDESYHLVMEPAAILNAKTVWGAIHGLQTFSQFTQWNGTSFIMQGMPAYVTDQPKFPWRGFLVDTSRHYEPLPVLMEVIELLAMNKMNVFHWHLTDAESFPVEISTRPELSREGAWTRQAVYTKRDIDTLIEFGRMRGVRVVPEIDTPGHTYSWGNSHPEIILDCKNLISRRKDYAGINNVPFDMTSNTTYQVVESVIAEISKLFADDFIHLGGDEISGSCVDEFPRIKQWMKAQGMNTNDYTDLVKYYERKLVDIVKRNGNKKMIFWQELFEMFIGKPNNPLPPDTIIHVWINPGSAPLVRQIVESGYSALVSSGWYLDQQIPARDGKTTHYLWLDTWRDFYLNDILENVRDLSPAKQALVKGGEVAQWGEQVDDASIVTRSWPRAAAAAERLWTGAAEDADVAFHRLSGHRCRLYQRGFSASPLRPDHCERRR